MDGPGREGSEGEDRENGCCCSFLSLSTLMKNGYESNTHTPAAFIRLSTLSRVRKTRLENRKVQPLRRICIHKGSTAHLICVLSQVERYVCVFFFFLELPPLLFSYANNKERRRWRSRRRREGIRRTLASNKVMSESSLFCMIHSLIAVTSLLLCHFQNRGFILQNLPEL